MKMNTTVLPKKSTTVLPQLLALIEGLPEKEQWALYHELMKKPIKRRHLRMPSGLEIGYSINGKEYVDRMKDMSYEGLFIETKNKFSVGQGVKLQIPIEIHPGLIKSQVLLSESRMMGSELN